MATETDLETQLNYWVETRDAARTALKDSVASGGGGELSTRDARFSFATIDELKSFLAHAEKQVEILRGSYKPHSVLSFEDLT